jgi:hypothetical protein
MSAKKSNLAVPVELSGSNIAFVGEHMTEAFKRHQEFQELKAMGSSARRQRKLE